MRPTLALSVVLALAVTANPVEHASTGPVLGPASLVFDNPDYPGCCSRAVSVGANTSSDPDTVCLFRIPVVLRVPGTRIVLAFAEARLGGGAGCADGSGPAVAYRRSADGGRSWAPLRWIANDTDPIHVALKDHIVLGMSHFDPASQTSFLFYTTCYRMCEFTTTLVIRSKDHGATWSTPEDGNLTSMLLRSNISMMQWGEGQGVVLPGGDGLLLCGWFKPAGTPAGELRGNTSVACIASTDAGESWEVRGQLPLPLPSAVNEVAIGLTPNGSVYASYRSNTRVKTRYQSWSNDGGRTFSKTSYGVLPAPVCNAGIMGIDGGEQMVYAHIEPGVNTTTGLSLETRENMVVRTSRDGGGTFSPPTPINGGLPAAYIALTTADRAGTVGALYEHGHTHTDSCYQHISYQEMTFA